MGTEIITIEISWKRLSPPTNNNIISQQPIITVVPRSGCKRITNMKAPAIIRCGKRPFEKLDMLGPFFDME